MRNLYSDSVGRLLLGCSIVLALTCAMNLSKAATSEPPAASPAFTSKDKTVLQARRLMDQGRFSDAEKKLQAKADKGSANDIEARAELLEIIRRTRREYALTLDALLREVQADIPDTSARDLDKWIRESKIRERRIDGERFFFSGEPKNIYLFSSSAKARLTKAGKGKKTAKWKLTDHLQAIVNEAEKTGQVEVLPVKHRFTHRLTIDAELQSQTGFSCSRVAAVPAGLPSAERRQTGQRIARSKIDRARREGRQPSDRRTAAHGLFRKSRDEHRRSFGLRGRSGIYFSQPTIRSLIPPPFNLCPPIGKAPAWANVRRISSSRPKSKSRSLQSSAKKPTHWKRRARIFRWVSANIPWNSEDEYCIIPSFALKGFNARRGDCGVQNTVFITMCRIAGVPGAMAKRLRNQTRQRRLGHARLGRNLHRAVGLVAGRCFLRREKIR